MLRPNGAHLFVRGKFTAIRLRKGFVKGGCFLGAQLQHRLIFPGQLQKHAGKVVLHFSRKAAHGLDSLFKQFGHGQKIGFSLAVWKDFCGQFNQLREQNRDRNAKNNKGDTPSPLSPTEAG
jgi:hypothetical protein